MRVEAMETICDPVLVPTFRPREDTAITVGQVMISYLNVLRADRPYESMAAPMGVGEKQVGHILRGRNKVSVAHLQSVAEVWDFPIDVMFRDLWQVAANLAAGRAPEVGVSLMPPGARSVGAARKKDG